MKINSKKWDTRSAAMNKKVYGSQTQEKQMETALGRKIYSSIQNKLHIPSSTITNHSHQQLTARTI